jgi:hypothetical protein
LAGIGLEGEADCFEILQKGCITTVNETYTVKIKAGKEKKGEWYCTLLLQLCRFG